MVFRARAAAPMIGKVDTPLPPSALESEPGTVTEPVAKPGPYPEPDSALLARLERFYDAVPRTGARTEEIGPFTLFVPTGGGTYYARPRLGLASGISTADVGAVLARQRELGLPEAIEWVLDTTPSLSAAARAHGLQVEEVPLLVLGESTPAAAQAPAPLPDGVHIRRVTADEPDLARIRAVAEVAFGHDGTAVGVEGAGERDELARAEAGDHASLRARLAAGRVVLYVAEADDGPLASGAHQRVDETTEIVAVATLPAARRRGLGAAITGALVADALAAGCTTIFLSADSDEVARIYERLGFRRVAQAGIAERT